MSAEARAARKENFKMPTKSEIDAIRQLESEREQRRAQRAQREQSRNQTELQRASIAANILLQMNPAFETSKKLIGQTRDYLEGYFDKALPELSAPPEADDADEQETQVEGEPATGE